MTNLNKTPKDSYWPAPPISNSSALNNSAATKMIRANPTLPLNSPKQVNAQLCRFCTVCRYSHQKHNRRRHTLTALRYIKNGDLSNHILLYISRASEQLLFSNVSEQQKHVRQKQHRHHHALYPSQPSIQSCCFRHRGSGDFGRLY